MAPETRAALAWLPAEDDTPASWLLEVIGKGRKRCFVPVSDECADALRAHRRDRGRDFDAADAAGPLVVPSTPRARAKFGAATSAERGLATRHATRAA